MGSGEAAFGATEKEVDALKAAARSGDELMTPERLLGDSEELAEEGTHITKTGELWTCSSPCTQFRSRYAAALAQEETLLPELEDVEKLAKEAAARTTKGDHGED